jgi:uncharacterized membrane protein YkvA (DUF1232 family)
MDGAWRKRAYALKENTYALYLASRDSRVPLAAKVVIAVVVAYALSPIDLIPDFIPVVGYMDDLVLLPLGIWLAIRLIPKHIWRECQASAREQLFELPRHRRAGAVIVFIWLLALVGVVVWVWSFLNGAASA